jgi:hypothetical protein
MEEPQHQRPDYLSWPPPMTQAPTAVTAVTRHGSGFGIASALLGFFAVVPLSIAFGIVALMGERPRRGKVLAVLGIALSSLWLAVALVAGGAVLERSSATTSAPAAAGAPPAGGNVNKLPGYRGLALEGELRVGDCLQVPATLPKVEVTFVEIDCAQPHNAEVYVTGSLPWAMKYPGTDRVETEIRDTCGRHLATFLPPGGSDAISYRYLYPSAKSWSYNQEYACIAHDLTREVRGTLGRVAQQQT